MPIIEADHGGRIDIYYEEEGDGDPLVLIGGITSTVEVWGLQRPAFADHYRVILPDNRGSGRTRVPDDDGDRSPDRFAGDVLALIDTLDLERVHLLGASMGGIIAQAFAVLHQDRLRSLTLCCTACGGPEAVRASPEVLAKFVGSPGGSTDMTILAHPDSVAANNPGLAFFESTKKGLPHSPEEIQRRAMALTPVDLSEAIRCIDVPTLVMTGADDVLIPPENSRLIADRIPGARLVEISKTGHIFFAEKPEECNAAVLEFLGGA